MDKKSPVTSGVTQEMMVRSLGWKDPLWRKAWQPRLHSCLEKNPWIEAAWRRQSPWGLKEPDTTEAAEHALTHVLCDLESC